MKGEKRKRREKIMKILAISSVIISLVLSSIALHNSSDLDELKSGDDGETSLSRIGDLYGTNGCENGGFSIQIGIDNNGNGVLDNTEVSDIRNVCHGAQGPPGPMGNRGYWGYNGTDGLNGSNGVIGTSAFIDSFVGQHGPCPHAAIIEMGNNSTSGVVDSSIKICFEELLSGRLTDIHPNSGDSFSTACNGGATNGDLFLFAAARDGNCLLYKFENGIIEQVSANIDFLPGAILGFEVHEDRIWFDADDGSGRQMWSSDGDTLWRETNLSSQIQEGDEMIMVQNELILNHQGGITIFAESDTMIGGTFSNLSKANQNLIYNTANGFSLLGDTWPGEIHSDVTYHSDYYWFVAETDSFGKQLHRANSSSVERITTQLTGNPGQIISPTNIGESIVFDSNGLVSLDINSLQITELNTSIQSIPQDSDWIVNDELLWFECGIPSNGYELCVSDGENAWLHSDHVVGMESSSPGKFALIGDEIILLIEDPTQGGQLARITDTGLEMLWDHDSGNLESGVHGQLWVGNDFVFFIADDSSLGLELYAWAHGEISEEWIIIH
tara:strand:- start:389 stop:2056 length:1668 start_codon:yes stop_codon:yes gene_type:complete